MLSASQWTSANLTNSCRGTIGPIGNIGPSGQSGPRGQSGSNGQIGSRGPTGPVGPSGPSGQSGPNGPDATSVYPVGSMFGRVGPTGDYIFNYLDRSQIGKLFVLKIDTSNVIVVSDNNLQSGDWFMISYPYPTPSATVLLQAQYTPGDNYAETVRGYVLSRESLGKDSIWYAYYYKDHITQTNNLYLY